jgi:hypothetical protein
MTYKLAALIVGLGVIACVLLGIRQLRVQAAHEMADVQRRVSAHDRELWTLRTEIAKLTTPDKIETLAQKYGVLTPINAERMSILARLEALDLTATASVDSEQLDRR